MKAKFEKLVLSRHNWNYLTGLFFLKESDSRGEMRRWESDVGAIEVSREQDDEQTTYQEFWIDGEPSFAAEVYNFLRQKADGWENQAFDVQHRGPLARANG